MGLAHCTRCGPEIWNRVSGKIKVPFFNKSPFAGELSELMNQKFCVVPKCPKI